MEFKGKGNHSVNELESICIDYEEKLHQKQLSNQELLEALINVVNYINVSELKEIHKIQIKVYSEQAINKALK